MEVGLIVYYTIDDIDANWKYDLIILKDVKQNLAT